MCGLTEIRDMEESRNSTYSLLVVFVVLKRIWENMFLVAVAHRHGNGCMSGGSSTRKAGKPIAIGTLALTRKPFGNGGSISHQKCSLRTGILR